jgi:hypothetical protein
VLSLVTRRLVAFCKFPRIVRVHSYASETPVHFLAPTEVNCELWTSFAVLSPRREDLFARECCYVSNGGCQ